MAVRSSATKLFSREDLAPEHVRRGVQRLPGSTPSARLRRQPPTLLSSRERPVQDPAWSSPFEPHTITGLDCGRGPERKRRRAPSTTPNGHVRHAIKASGPLGRSLGSALDVSIDWGRHRSGGLAARVESRAARKATAIGVPSPHPAPSWCRPLEVNGNSPDRSHGQALGVACYLVVLPHGALLRRGTEPEIIARSVDPLGCPVRANVDGDCHVGFVNAHAVRLGRESARPFKSLRRLVD
jgi:hypothetical protein